jgi:hypothetical protein
MPDTGRSPNVSGLSAGALERVRRELAVSLGLARPGSPVRVPVLTLMGAIDAETAFRAGTTPLQCGCGFATSNQEWFDGHLFDHPGHSRQR